MVLERILGVGCDEIIMPWCHEHIASVVIADLAAIFVMHPRHIRPATQESKNPHRISPARSHLLDEVADVRLFDAQPARSSSVGPW